MRAFAGDMRTDISQEPVWIEIYRQNGRRRLRGHRFVRACAVEMHLDISQEPFCMEFSGKMPDAPETISIEHQALTITLP